MAQWVKVTEFNSWNPHGGRTEWTPTFSSDLYMCALALVHTQLLYTYTNKYTYKQMDIIFTNLVAYIIEHVFIVAVCFQVYHFASPNNLIIKN